MSKELQYHVRKTWEDAESQVGIDYNFLINAQKACDKLENYKVFDSNGQQVYPEHTNSITTITFNVGDVVEIKPGTILTKGRKVLDKYIGVPMYITAIRDNSYAVAEEMDQIQIGYVYERDILPYIGINNAEIDPYYATVLLNTEIKAKPDNTARTLEIAKKFAFYKIVNEKNGWGKLELGLGWINLKDIEKI